MKLVDIDFPDPVINALRNNTLVIFAGAGVSRGNPAYLPDFSKLTKKIAEYTGKTKGRKEREDRFLGRLCSEGVKVHKIAAQILEEYNLKPTKLHRNLLKLYTNADQVRIVTTNFDPLFERADPEEFEGSKPKVFDAPALPLGSRFHGVVHVHGSITRPEEMVLTDTDFGKGYLTEGWARRFLVDLFENFTVLFIGYSHNDIIMNYLARAITGDSADTEDSAKRFALTSPKDLERWRGLGVQPIEGSHSQINKGIEKLSIITNRGILGWEQEVTAIAKKQPPLERETTDTIKYVLENEKIIHLFTKVCRDPRWISWLYENGCLDSLFSNSNFGKKEETLANWLAKHFSSQHANHLFLLIGKYNTRIHPDFWLRLGDEVVSDKQNFDTKIFSCWVPLLLDNTPNNILHTPHLIVSIILASIGKHCIKYKMLDNLVQVFNTMTKNQLCIQYSPSEVGMNLLLIGEHHNLNELWKELKPNLADVAQPLLKRFTIRLEEQHLILCSWGQASSTWSSLNSDRAAIEPHEQNELGYPNAYNVLIDAARDCLEWLMKYQTEIASQWCTQHVGSEVPLLRRLAIHTLSKCEKLTADQKIDQYLTHTDLYDLATQHEIFTAVKQAYPESDIEHRKKIIKTILAYKRPNKKSTDRKGLTEYQHFNWLIWLYDEASPCNLLKGAINDIKKQYPYFEKREHPDLQFWVSIDSDDDSPSPLATEQLLTAKQLLTESIDEWLPGLLSLVKPEKFPRSACDKQLSEIEKATKANFKWSNKLAETLTEEKEWDTDIWHTLLYAWQEMELDKDKCREVLKWISEPKLYSFHLDDIVNALYALVKDSNKPYISSLLPQMNKIAITLWRKTNSEKLRLESNDWFDQAINHPAGVLTEFWLYSLSQKQKDSPSKVLINEYCPSLSEIIQETSLAGILGRSILTSQFAFLLSVDEEWTKENLVPLFSKDDEDFQAAWDGFLGFGYLNPTVAESLKEAFLRATTRINHIPIEKKLAFVEYYIAIFDILDIDPREEWIPTLFCRSHKEIKNSSVLSTEKNKFDTGGNEFKKIFALKVGEHLSTIDEEKKRKWWKRWLKTYWENRLLGKPAKLEKREVECMLDWLPYFGSLFPEAVELTIQMPTKFPETVESTTQTRTASLEGHFINNQFGKDKLWKNYPESVAKLLIYLKNWENDGIAWHRGEELINKLLASDISSSLKHKLRELAAKLNLKIED